MELVILLATATVTSTGQDLCVISVLKDGRDWTARYQFVIQNASAGPAASQAAVTAKSTLKDNIVIDVSIRITELTAAFV